MVGDVLRRLVARTLAQQFSLTVLEATSPFQFALSTNQVRDRGRDPRCKHSSLDENATVVSIDGVGAFDLISRNAMVSGLMAMENGDRMWPFIRERMIVGSPMTFPKEKAVSSRCSLVCVCTRV